MSQKNQPKPQQSLEKPALEPPAKSSGRQGPTKPKGPGLFSVLKPYRGMIILLVLLSLISNSISLAIPNISRHAIDAFIGNRLDVGLTLWLFIGAAVGVFIFTFGLSFVQTYASERVARDLRTQLAARL